MAGISRAAVFVCLTILVCSYATFCQDIPSGDSPQATLSQDIPSGGWPQAGEKKPVEDPTLYPVETPPVAQLVVDGPNPGSCLGQCQEKCQKMPIECEFIDDSLPVNCEMDKKEKCPDSCDSICECTGVCEEGCTTGNECNESCLDKCFQEHGFNPQGVEGVPPAAPETTPPNSV